MTVARELVETVSELREQLSAARRAGKRIGLVPTMGALHEGHLALITRARQHNEFVGVSIFVNPTQFGPKDDYEQYPRDLERDVVAATSAGATLCFAPSVGEMYPGGTGEVSVDPGPLGELLEGEFRPGHFRGVATVVTKLLGLFRADEAVFGEKDYQQLLVIQALARELLLGTSIVSVETIRETDGLAKSSRNRRLSPSERAKAPALYQALRAGGEAFAKGKDVASIEAVMRASIEEAGFALDYAVCRDAGDLGELAPDAQRARLLVAARLSNVRLIDNVAAHR